MRSQKASEKLELHENGLKTCLTWFYYLAHHVMFIFRSHRPCLGEKKKIRDLLYLDELKIKTTQKNRTLKVEVLIKIKKYSFQGEQFKIILRMPSHQRFKQMKLS